jgi:hypothetical protein
MHSVHLLKQIIVCCPFLIPELVFRFFFLYTKRQYYLVKEIEQKKNESHMYLHCHKIVPFVGFFSRRMRTRHLRGKKRKICYLYTSLSRNDHKKNLKVIHHPRSTLTLLSLINIIISCWNCLFNN